MSAVPETFHQCDEDLFDVRSLTFNYRFHVQVNLVLGNRNSDKHSQCILPLYFRMHESDTKEAKRVEHGFFSELVGPFPTDISLTRHTKKRSFTLGSF